MDNTYETILKESPKKKNPNNQMNCKRQNKTA